jgi:hypothetical protein
LALRLRGGWAAEDGDFRLLVRNLTIKHKFPSLQGIRDLTSEVETRLVGDPKCFFQAYANVPRWLLTVGLVIDQKNADRSFPEFHFFPFGMVRRLWPKTAPVLLCSVSTPGSLATTLSPLAHYFVGSHVSLL